MGPAAAEHLFYSDPPQPGGFYHCRTVVQRKKRGLGFSVKGNYGEQARQKGRSAFGINMKMTPLKEKVLIATGCCSGIFLVAYGMVMKNNPVFVLGIVIVITSYLAIRRKLKEALRQKKPP